MNFKDQFHSVYLVEVKDTNGVLRYRRVAFHLGDAENWLETFVSRMGWKMNEYSAFDGVIDTGSEFFTYAYNAIGVV